MVKLNRVDKSEAHFIVCSCRPGFIAAYFFIAPHDAYIAESPDRVGDDAEYRRQASGASRCCRFARIPLPPAKVALGERLFTTRVFSRQQPSVAAAMIGQGGADRSRFSVGVKGAVGDSMLHRVQCRLNIANSGMAVPDRWRSRRPAGT